MHDSLTAYAVGAPAACAVGAPAAYAAGAAGAPAHPWIIRFGFGLQVSHRRLGLDLDLSQSPDHQFGFAIASDM